MRILNLLAASMPALGVAACAKPVADNVDAGAVAVAASASGAGTVDAALATSTTSATTTATSVAPAGIAQPTGGAFQGNFLNCLTGGLKTAQTGAHVVGHSGDNSNMKLAHDVINFSCSVTGDVCTGTATTVNKAPGGKRASSEGPPRKMKLTHGPDGALQFFQDGQPAPAMCGKSS